MPRNPVKKYKAMQLRSQDYKTEICRLRWLLRLQARGDFTLSKAYPKLDFVVVSMPITWGTVLSLLWKKLFGYSHQILQVNSEHICCASSEKFPSLGGYVTLRKQVNPDSFSKVHKKHIVI